jgi:hypothetical protein
MEVISIVLCFDVDLHEYGVNDPKTRKSNTSLCYVCQMCIHWPIELFSHMCGISSANKCFSFVCTQPCTLYRNHHH